MLDKNRLQEMLVMASYLLPINDSNKELIEAQFGKGFYKEFPQFMRSLGIALMNYEEETVGWLDWLIEAIQYAKCETDRLPTVEGGDTETLTKMIAIQTSQEMTQAEKIKKMKEIQDKAPPT